MIAVPVLIFHPNFEVVWASAVQGLSPVHGNSGKLGDRLCRILLPSAGQSDRPWSVYGGTAYDDSRSYHAGRLLNVLGRLPEEAMKWNYMVGFALIVVAVFVIFKEWRWSLRFHRHLAF
ncbi:MAG: hypothetical protein OEV99_00165 [Nitrospira sp.]|nr:hypothetical protein [Nitrospira sp.]MDH4368226.1 hypothetical protein [Nitrospira sp.]MDH5348424.1 hypothetical protein [Nitrospira sp.]MDH5495866.1 hypothetical protein [Nitrospira sp.]MDH5725543.1 hypothetical protein [Nitrospira sp.]